MRVLCCLLVSGAWLARSVVAAEPEAAQEKRPESAFQVKGQVVDEDGRRLPGVNVESIFPGDEALARTDNSGRFVLKLPRKPTQALQLRAVDAGGSLQAFARFVLNKSATFLDVEPGLPDEVELVLRPARRIEVTVVDENQQPVARAQVFVGATWFQKLAEARTDAAGDATLLVPADAPLSSIVAMKPGAGIDYFHYQHPDTPKSDPYHLPRDRSEPLTLVLDGVRRVTIKAVDERGQPMPGVSVYPWFFEKPKKGGLLNTSGIGEFHAATDPDGRVTFDTLPADCVKPITFWVEREGYYAPERATLMPGTKPAAITATLVKLLTVRGQVTFDDGRPAADATVQTSGHGYTWNDFYGQVQTDAQGRFELGVYPERFYAFAASLGTWATPLVTRVIRNEAPADELQLVLGKTTRVFGRLTIGPDRRPYIGQRVAFHRSADKEYEKLAAGDKFPKIDNRQIRPSLGSSAVTGEHGEFEFLVGPGECTVFLVPSGPAKSFVLNDETEYEVNLHLDRPSEEKLAGRVVLAEQPDQGVAEAQVSGFSVESRPPDIEAITGVDGSFEVVRQPLEMIVYARSEDGSLAGFARVGADDRSAVIRIAAAASAHGRLLDATTGEPLSDMEVRARSTISYRI